MVTCSLAQKKEEETPRYMGEKGIPKSKQGAKLWGSRPGSLQALTLVLMQIQDTNQCKAEGESRIPCRNQAPKGCTTL